MLSQSKVSASSKKYYLELGREDYFADKNNVKGRWLGKGSLHFGLAGVPIEPHCTSLTNLINGKDPRGVHELRRGGGTVKVYRNKVTGKVTKKSNPVCGIDNTFSAPKDVSLLWALSDKETQNQILRIHQEAVQEGISYIEDEVYTRTHSRNPDGTRTMRFHKASGVFATFDHFTSRELDPQLHTHAVLLNVAIRENDDSQGAGGAVDGNKIFQVRYIAGQAYQDALRQGLEKEYGIVTCNRPFSDGKGVSFEISGITKIQRKKFSQRRTQIEKHLTAEMTGKDVHAIVLETRRRKIQPSSPDLLFEEWRNRGRELGFDFNTVLSQQKNTFL